MNVNSLSHFPNHTRVSEAKVLCCICVTVFVVGGSFRRTSFFISDSYVVQHGGDKSSSIRTKGNHNKAGFPLMWCNLLVFRLERD